MVCFVCFLAAQHVGNWQLQNMTCAAQSVTCVPSQYLSEKAKTKAKKINNNTHTHTHKATGGRIVAAKLICLFLQNCLLVFAAAKANLTQQKCTFTAGTLKLTATADAGTLLQLQRCSAASVQAASFNKSKLNVHRNHKAY